MAMRPKTLSFYVCLVLGVGLTGWTAIEWFVHQGIGGPQFDAIVVSGYSAASALAISFLVSPLIKVASWFKVRLPTAHLVAFRRSFGLLAAWMGSVHLATVITGYLYGKWEALLHSFFLNAGTLAYLLLLALALSSFPGLIKKLGIKLWGELHMLTYAAVAVATFHLAASAFVPVWVSLLAAVLIPGLIVIRLLPARRRQRQA